MNTSYLLDTSVLSCFFRTQTEEDLAKCAQTTAPVIFPEEVCDELRRIKNMQTRVDRLISSPGVRMLPLEVGSVAHGLLNELHTNVSGMKNLGERACIALAATLEPSPTFVASDKGGMWIALRELHKPGERVLGIHVFLRRLHEHAGLPLSALDAVAHESCLPTPSWWPVWRSQQQPDRLVRLKPTDLATSEASAPVRPRG